MHTRNSITIRYATIEDIKIIQDFQIRMEHYIEEEPSPDAVGKAGVEFILSNAPKHGFYIVAEFGENIAGCLRISFERSVSSNGFFWWIQNVYVHESYRKIGVFQKLYREVIRLAEEATDVVEIKLHVHTNNPNAIGAYEKAGMDKSPEFVYIHKMKMNE